MSLKVQPQKTIHPNQVEALGDAALRGMPSGWLEQALVYEALSYMYRTAGMPVLAEASARAAVAVIEKETARLQLRLKQKEER